MNYTAIVVTHGDSAPLGQALTSFFGRVRPLPRTIHVVYDEDSAGFCVNTGRAWQVAAAAATSHVFWLEHDFLFTRDVDLEQLAAVLDGQPQLAQMALVRQAVNEQELAAGGLVESRPGEFTPRDGWLEQRSFFTTNPSLMRVDFMRANPWPPYTANAEGLFGIDLRGRGYSFGMWGAGEPWVEHVGVRTGHGY